MPDVLLFNGEEAEVVKVPGRVDNAAGSTCSSAVLSQEVVRGSLDRMKKKVNKADLLSFADFERRVLQLFGK